jgi:hypothetical protein
MALGDLASVRLQFVAPSYSGECALSMQCISPFTNWRTLLATEVLTQIVPDWMDVLGFNVALRDIVVEDVVPGTGADATLHPTPAPHGTVAAEESPGQLAYVISWRSDGIGRNTRGRNYLFGLPKTQITHSTWDSGSAAAVQNLVEVILAQYGPTGFSDLARLGIISRGPHDAPLAVPQYFPVTHAFFDATIRTMRKRVR